MNRPGFYGAIAALNLTTSSAGIRPRSLTSMPWALAHSRTSVVFGAFAAPCVGCGLADWRWRRRGGQRRRSGQGVSELLGVLGVQVDLVLSAI